MTAKLVNDSICYKNHDIKVDDLFNDSFYEYADKECDNYFNNTYGVNEVYNNLILYYIAIKKWIIDNCSTQFKIGKGNDDYMFYTYDICNQLSVPVSGYRSFSGIKTCIVYQAYKIASALDIIYLLLRIPRRDKIREHEKFAVIRHKGAIKKFKKFNEISQEIETLEGDNSIYRLFSRWKRVKWVFKAYFNTISSFREMELFYKPLLGAHFKYALMNFYKKRIVYAELYKLMLDEYFSYFEGKNFYTGNNLDRHSVIEDQLAKRHAIKTYNIPHGIEYGFKHPAGFSSDVFYAHSQYTADYFNKLYKTNKYVFDKDIIKRMFEYGYGKPHEKMIIFFTEPREVHVNLEIINGLLPKMKEKGLKLYLKLHPGDNKGNYDGLDIDYITDYELSLTGNICISRKSTILLEAIYNNSLPVAIITNVMDQTMFNRFPSLNAKEIVKTYNVDELFEVIQKNIQN